MQDAKSRQVCHKGSLLGVLLFNVYLNDMFDSVQADLYSFTDDNNLSTIGNTILYASKKNLINQQTTNIRGISLKSEANFTLLGIDIDNCLSFHGHRYNLCIKAANQIHVLKRLSSFMVMTEKTILMKSFVLSNFIYYSLAWHFCSERDTEEWKRSKKALRMVLDNYESDYKTFLQKSKMQTLHVGGVKILAIEILRPCTH